MTGIDILIGLALLALVLLAVHAVRKGHGRCSGDCAHCGKCRCSEKKP